MLLDCEVFEIPQRDLLRHGGVGLSMGSLRLAARPRLGKVLQNLLRNSKHLFLYIKNVLFGGLGLRVAV